MRMTLKSECRAEELVAVVVVDDEAKDRGFDGQNDGEGEEGEVNQGIDYLD